MSKIKLVWFIDVGDTKEFQVNAKLHQLTDYVDKTKFFNQFHVLIVPAKENKFQILDGNDEIPTDEKELKNWLTTIKNKLKDCITVYL